VTDKEQAWADIDGPAPKCDACGERIYKNAANRPFQFTALARAGYMHVVCEGCADEMSAVDFGRVSRLLNQIVKRVLP